MPHRQEGVKMKVRDFSTSLNGFVLFGGDLSGGM